MQLINRDHFLPALSALSPQQAHIESGKSSENAGREKRKP